MGWHNSNPCVCGFGGHVVGRRPPRPGYGAVSERSGVFGTTKMSVEIEGSVDKVISVLRRLGSTGGITMSTSFQEEYQALECEFRARVDEDNEYNGAQSVYLPNLAPQRPADFVLVAMEPSTGGGAGELKKGKAFSPKNFSGSVEDFILHFCIGKYLCGGGRTYHLTDLSKGAMLTRHASDKPEERYLRWYPLLKKELKLVAKPNAPIIAIGNVVHGFLDKNRSLDKQGMPGLTGSDLALLANRPREHGERCPGLPSAAVLRFPHKSGLE